MTFSLSQEEWVQGHRTLARAHNRLEIPMIFLALFFAFGFLFCAYITRDFGLFGLALFFCCGAFCVCAPSWILAFRFRRQFGEQTPLFQLRCWSNELSCLTSAGEQIVPWDELKKPLEGQSVWILFSRGSGRLLCIIPKHTIQTPEGAREWEFIKTNCERPAILPEYPPIALP